MLSLNKLLCNGRASYVVSCELPDGNDHHVVKSRKFDCDGVDDPGTQANAVRFAKAAETVPEFRAFLFGEPDRLGRDQRTRVRSYVCVREKPLTGVRYAVAMSRLENGQLRSMSFFRGTAADEVTDAKGENQVLGKAERFLRSVAFENWRRQVSRESLLKSREQSGGSQHSFGKERGLKHPHSFVEIDGGEKVDCKCGKNRSHGLMMACERCGAWEHAECQGFRSNKQIPADYICSACVRAEREEVIVIRCEEQVHTLEVKGRAFCRDNVKRTSDIEKGKFWSTSSGDGLAGMTSREHEHRRHVCSLCGCEDNEYFEALVQACSCVGCSVLAHSSCFTVMKVGASPEEQRLQRTGVCFFCGSSVKDGVGNESKLQKAGRWVEEVPDSANTKVVKGDQMGLARKRLRSTGSGGSIAPGKPEHGEKQPVKCSKNEMVPNTVLVEKVQLETSPPDSKRGSSPFLGRRFSDAAANVPIKKRRIQLEMARSPSPPPENLKLQPDIPAVHEVLVATKPSDSQSSEEVNVTDADSDGNGSGSEKSFTAALVPKCDSIAPSRALITSEAIGFGVTAPGTDTEGGIVVGQSSHQDVGCMSEKGDGESQHRKGNRSATENGGSPANNRINEEISLVSHADVQEQKSPAHSVSIPSRSGEQACAVEPGIQSEDILSDLSREARAVLSPKLKRKFSETDMGSPGRDHLGEIESSRSRANSRAGHLNSQASIAGGTGEEYVRGLALEGSAGRKVSTLVENNLRDDRLHWDLNMDMEEWERPSVEDSAVAMAQNLSSSLNTGVEKRESSRSKESVQDSHMRQSGVGVGSSTSVKGGRLEQECPPQDSADALRTFDGVEAGDGSLKSKMQLESVDEMSLTASRMTDDQGTSTSSPATIVDIHAAKELEHPEDTPEMVCNSLEGNRSTSAFQNDSQYGEPEIAPAPDEEAEVCRIRESPLVVGPIADRETEGKVDLVADKNKTDCDHRGSGAADVGAVTACVNLEQGNCGTQCVKEPADCGEAADIVQSQKLSDFQIQKGHSSVLMTATADLTSTTPAAKMSSTMNSTKPERCEEEGTSHEDEKMVEKETVEEFVNERNQSSSSPSRQPGIVKWEGDDGEDLGADDVDYGDSDMREGDDLDMEDRLQRGAGEVESTWNPYDDTKVSEAQVASTSQDASAASPSHRDGADGLSNVIGSPGPTRKRRHQSESSGAEEFPEVDTEEAHAVQVEDPNRDPVPVKGSPISEMNGDLVVDQDKVGDEHGNGSASVATSDSHPTSLDRAEDMAGSTHGVKAVRKSEVWRESSEGGVSRARTKSGWDQLPEGFQSAEEALQASRSNAGQSSWGSSHYGPGFSGWNGSSNVHFSSGDNRYLPGHGRGMLPGPAADRGSFEKAAWNRSDHPRRSRIDTGLELHGRVPVNQELRQSSGSRPRPGSLEPGHRQRRQGGWADDAGAPPLWTYGPGRQLSQTAPSREPFAFHPSHKTRNAAAVAAAKVESSGLVVAPDGTVIKAGTGAPAPLRGLGGKGRGGGFGDINSNGVMTGVGNTGLSHSLRVGGDVDLRSRECLGVDTRVSGSTDSPTHFKRAGERFGPPFPPGSSIARGAPGMVGTPSRYRWTRDERSFPPPGEQEERPLFSKRRSVDSTSLPRSRPSPPSRSTNEVLPDDGAAAPAKKSRTTQVTDTKAEVRPEISPAEPDSSAPAPPKLPLPPPPPRAQRSPPAGLKRLNSKREVDWPRGRERSRDREREWDRERAGSRNHYSPSRRSSPHVIHGSALTDERDRLLLAGIDRSRDQGATASVNPTEDAQPPQRGRSIEDVHEVRRARHYDGHSAKGDDLAVKSRTPSKGGDAKDTRSEADRGSRVANDTRSDTRREFQKPGANYKHSSSREGEDDVAPRRRRPS